MKFNNEGMKRYKGKLYLKIKGGRTPKQIYDGSLEIELYSVPKAIDYEIPAYLKIYKTYYRLEEVDNG